MALEYGVGDGWLVLFQSLLKAFALPSNSILAVTLLTLTWCHAMGHWCSGKAPVASYQASPKTFLPPQGLLQGGGKALMDFQPSGCLESGKKCTESHGTCAGPQPRAPDRQSSEPLTPAPAWPTRCLPPLQIRGQCSLSCWSPTPKSDRVHPC